MNWLDYCLAKPGAWRDEPWEGDVVVKVGSKIFAFLGSVDPEGTPPDPPGINDPPNGIGLRCGDRETADLLIERYPAAVSRSAYIGKHGWNSITLDGTIPDDEIAELIDDSYAQVVARLPRRERPG